MAPTDPLLQTATDSIGGWIDAAVAAGWLDASAHERLEATRLSTPADLFDAAERPLVVGLFGGTGVGKSTLLNRIAGQDIARASAERPTSTRVTAYLHQSRHLDRLPADFPMQRLNTAIHHEDRWRDVLWLDMPDIDSVETEHRMLTLAWLEFIDVVVYVVSPERYRDSEAWTVLREHGREHAWMFVFNQSDRGQSEQVADFGRMLGAAGFADPAVFATSSAPGAESPEDDFKTLVITLTELADRQLIDDLARRGVTERVATLFQLADELAGPGLQSMGPDDSLPASWAPVWHKESPPLTSALRAQAVSVVAEGHEGMSAGSAAKALVDEAAVARVDTLIGAFLQQLDTQGALPRAAAQRGLAQWRQQVPAAMESAVTGAVGESLARPGTPLQRFAITLCSLLSGVLPLAALAWVAWRVVAAFQSGVTDATAYLNVNFAITAVMLVGIAWALPWWLGRRMQPDPKATLQRGLFTGIDRALERTNDEFTARLQDLQDTRSHLHTTLTEARQQVGDAVLPGKRRGGAGLLPEPLRRLMTTDA